MKISEEDSEKRHKYLKPLIIGSIVFVIGLWTLNLIFLSPKEDEVVEGGYGDIFGAVNAIFSGFAFAGIIISLYLQRMDLKSQHEQLSLNRDEVKNTNKEFKIQNDTLRVQQFENQYYKMIDLHRANTLDVKIPYSELVKGYSVSDTGKERSQTTTTETKELAGKKVFVDMSKELEACLKICSKKFKKYGYEDKDVFHFAYKIFFWGVYSNFVNSDKIKLKHQKSVIKLYKKKQEEYKKNRKKGVKQNLRIRYVPFQGHESRLAHYYRHLFQTVKYVVETEKSGLIDYDESRQYLRILRAQLSNSEQLMLYYNYICDFGSEWDINGIRGNRFLTDYRMIHNMPLDRVVYVEKPKKHFSKFDSWCCSKNYPLFEMG